MHFGLLLNQYHDVLATLMTTLERKVDHIVIVGDPVQVVLYCQYGTLRIYSSLYRFHQLVDVTQDQANCEYGLI